jgi:glycosyltransferase involved in cell wall biosynthesis
MVDDPDAPVVLERVVRAHELVASTFSWRAVAERWRRFLDTLERSARVPSVAMVSSWNSRCGIADYSRYVVNHAQGSIRYQVFADKGVEVLDPIAELDVTRAWVSRWSPDLDELEEALQWADPDIVHFQFNFAFFELGHLAELIEKILPVRGVVVTFHRTKEAVIEERLVSLEDIASTLKAVDRIIVHQDSDARRLREMGIEENVSIIHHGALNPSVSGEVDVKRALGLSDKAVVGAFGFLLPHKGTLELVGAIDAVRTEVPNVHLLALCARHPNIASLEYEQEVRDEVARRGLEDRVTLITDFLDDDKVRVALRAADVLALPYQQTEESASGALRFILPVGRPIVASDLPIFDDARDGLFLVEPGNPGALAGALRDVLSDPRMQADLSRGTLAMARRFRWSLVAAQHRQIYQSIRTRRPAGPPARGQWPTSRRPVA